MPFWSNLVSQAAVPRYRDVAFTGLLAADDPGCVSQKRQPPCDEISIVSYPLAQTERRSPLLFSIRSVWDGDPPTGQGRWTGPARERLAEDQQDLRRRRRPIQVNAAPSSARLAGSGTGVSLIPLQVLG